MTTFSPQMKWFLFKLDALLKEHQVCLAAGRDGGLVTQSPLKSIKDDQYLAKFYPEEIPRDIGRNYTPPTKLIDWKTNIHRPGYTPRPAQLSEDSIWPGNSDKRVDVLFKDTDTPVGFAFDFFVHDGDLYAHLELDLKEPLVSISLHYSSEIIGDLPERITRILAVRVNKQQDEA